MKSIATLRVMGMAIIALTMTSCGSDPSSSNEPAITSPKSGSSFTFTQYQKDSTGKKIPTSEQTFNSAVIATNVTIMGKSDCIRFLEGVDTSDVHYLGNGDVDYLQRAITIPNPQFPLATIPARWVTFGYGSKSSIPIQGYDTTISFNYPGVPIPISVMIKASGNTAYLGTDELSTGSGKIATQKGLLTINVTFNSLIGSGSVTSIDTIWFAPKLGTFVKDDGLQTMEVPSFLQPMLGPSGTVGGLYRVLTNYFLK